MRSAWPVPVEFRLRAQAALVVEQALTEIGQKRTGCFAAINGKKRTLVDRADLRRRTP